jgi:isocitrate dehydrogenase
MTKHVVTFIAGDGVGPEVTNAARNIIKATDVNIEWEECLAGADIFKQGLETGVPEETLNSIKRTKVVLKGPLETPVGYGEKSANVTLRKLFETYANIRPIREFPNVPSPYQGRGIDFVIVRENVEDLYAGIEYMQTPGTAQTLKLITRKGCEKIVRVAFEFALAEGRSKVHCATKANIMKFSEGMLKQTFEEIASEYPSIEAQHIIVDNCAHQLVKVPEMFDVIVTTNMNGDILSDLGSGLIGGLGFAPSANLGNDIAIFEAVHGSAPKYAGKNTINPTAVIFSSLMMLRYLGEFEAANTIEQAVLVTLQEHRVLTKDVVGKLDAASTTAYCGEVIKNLGKRSDFWKTREYKPLHMPIVSRDPESVKATSKVVGVDVFIQSNLTANIIGKGLEEIVLELPIQLKMISNRGVKVYPSTGTSLDVVDLWSCRFIADEPTDCSDQLICRLLEKIGHSYTWMHLEKLTFFGDRRGFTKAQGED